jgi:hypothetical protein
VFISGSYSRPPEGWSDERINQLSYNLARELISKDYKVVSGFGLGIGSSVINGALSEIMSSKYKHIDEHLCMRPFPQNIADATERQNMWKVHREEMIRQAGVAIFIFGNKEKNSEIVIADGMLQEFDIAAEQGKIIIPVGVTGGAAAEIFEKMKSKSELYPYLYGHWDRLLTESDTNILIDLICKIITAQRNFTN